MPAGKWVKCGATGGVNARGIEIICTKKIGHTDLIGGYNAEHADTKCAPIVRWKDK